MRCGALFAVSHLCWSHGLQRLKRLLMMLLFGCQSVHLLQAYHFAENCRSCNSVESPLHCRCCGENRHPLFLFDLIQMLHLLMSEKKDHSMQEHLAQLKYRSVTVIQSTIIFCFELLHCGKLTTSYDRDDAMPTRRAASATHSLSMALKTGFHSARRSQLPNVGANCGSCDPTTSDEIISGGRHAYAANGVCGDDAVLESAVEVAVITTKANYLSTWLTTMNAIRSCYLASIFLVRYSGRFVFRQRCLLHVHWKVER